MEGGQFDRPCGFSKNISSRVFCEVNFNIIINYIFPENFIEIPCILFRLKSGSARKASHDYGQPPDY